MTTGTYGLGVKPLATTPRGAGLAGVAGGEMADASAGLGRAAQMETQLDIDNQRAKQETKAGNAQLGATLGGVAGAVVGGPWGAAIGSTLGGVVGGLF